MNKTAILLIIALLVSGAAAALWLPGKWADQTSNSAQEVTKKVSQNASESTPQDQAPADAAKPVTVTSTSAGKKVMEDIEDEGEQIVIDQAAIEEAQEPLIERIGELEEQLDVMRDELEQEKAERMALTDEHAKLQDQLALLDEMDTSDTSDGAVAGSVEDVHQMLQTSDFSAGARALRTSFSSPDVNSLIAAGTDETTAEDILRRMDEYALADLEIRDRAAREGWLDSNEFTERRSAELPEEIDLRRELGESGWDNYLYASGRSNRVVVANIIGGSAAGNAGIQPGDTIVSYAGNRIFLIDELQKATRSGERGELVTARLARGDTLVDIDVPRGPLGVSLSGNRVSPSE